MENTAKENKSQLIHKTKVIRFDDLVDRFKEKGDNLAKNPYYVRDILDLSFSVLEKLEELRRKKLVRLDLEIPRELAKLLGSNKVMRVSGIIRQTETKAIANLLHELKPSGFKKLSKVKNISFTALDTLEAVLLDQKLTEISEKVNDIDAKLDAQNRGALISALEQMKELSLIRDPETRRSKILFIQDRLNLCEHLYNDLYENKWHAYAALKEKFAASTFTNKSELIEMCQIGQQIPGLLEPVILCKIGQIKCCEIQEEFSLVQEKAMKLSYYVAGKLEAFKDEFNHQTWDIDKYKNITDFSREKTIAGIKDQILLPNEHMEYLLNSTLSFVLTVPEEISYSSGTPVSIGFFGKIWLWLKNLFSRFVVL
jgi:hypothetical protein